VVFLKFICILYVVLCLEKDLYMEVIVKDKLSAIHGNKTRSSPVLYIIEKLMRFVMIATIWVFTPRNVVVYTDVAAEQTAYNALVKT
jgi:hypothetical protein